MEIAARMSSKGQVTVPKAVRDALGIGEGYELRANVTAYDATYIALAEGLACTLLTADGRLARASSINCQVDVMAT